jgi:hypothetical protein
MNCLKDSVKNQTEKCRISLHWSVNEIGSFADVLKDSRDNSAFFCDTAGLSSFDGITLHSRRKSLNSLYIDLDNARPHNARQSTECLHAKRSSGYRTGLIAWTSHEVTSSLVISSEKLTEYDIPDRQSSKSAITHIFDEIEQETLISVFETEINRLAWMIEHEGKYVHQQMKNERKCLKIQ